MVDDFKDNYVIMRLLYDRFAYLLSNGSGINRLILDKVEMRTLKRQKLYTIASQDYFYKINLNNIKKRNMPKKGKFYLHYDLIVTSKRHSYKVMSRLVKANVILRIKITDDDNINRGKYKIAFNIPGMIDLILQYLDKNFNFDIELQLELESLKALKNYFVNEFKKEGIDLSTDKVIQLEELNITPPKNKKLESLDVIRTGC